MAAPEKSKSTSGVVVFIGAAGEMARIAIKRLALAGDWDLVLTDIRPEVLRPLAAELGPRARVSKLDLYDSAALASTIQGASLVILGAGPYIRTSAPVIEACLAARIPYLDFDDDVESTEHALTLDKRAKEAGIPIYVGCGASPGMTNVMAVDASRDLDEVHAIDVVWLVGDERPNVGRAVLDHLIHIAAGDCVTWEGGRRAIHETFVETDSFPILPRRPDLLLYETAHPEPTTLCRKFPKAERIRCLGGMDPPGVNGASRGLGLAVQNGHMTREEAITWLENVATGKVGALNGWRAALSGAWAQVRRGESSFGALIKFLVYFGTGHMYPYTGGLLAQVHGSKNGRPVTSSRRTELRSDFVFNNLGGVTGTACAAFAVLALDIAGTQAGAFAPEDWAEPALFYKALERVGVPREQIVETI